MEKLYNTCTEFSSSSFFFVICLCRNCIIPVQKRYSTCIEDVVYLYNFCIITVQNGENRGIFKYISGVSGVSPDQRAFCDTKCVSGKTEECVFLLNGKVDIEWYWRQYQQVKRYIIKWSKEYTKVFMRNK